MKTRLILKPGQRDAKRLARQHGDALGCVRLRYDAKNGKRLKTVERVAEETDWTPPALRYSANTGRG